VEAHNFCGNRRSGPHKESSKRTENVDGGKPLLEELIVVGVVMKGRKVVLV
jgi:hypothetical protein